MKYDCTEDIKNHIGLVQHWMELFSLIIEARAKVHDASKLLPPEKEMFDEYTYKLKSTEFGSEEYQKQLEGMGEALKHHYRNNAHHPEHFENGVNGMTLFNLVEMVCDWMAAAEKKGVLVDMDYLQKRFDISPQLRSIIENTFKEIDNETISNNAPRGVFYKHEV